MTLLPLEVDHERRQDRVVSGVRPDRLRVDHVDHAYERVAAAPPHVLIRVLVALQAAMLLPPALAPLQAAAARLARPLVTQTLVDADHRLGFDWVAYSTWLHASWLSDPTRWAYLAYAPLMAATLVGLAVVDWRRAVRFYGAVGAALLAAFAVFATWPADNAAGAHGVLCPWSIDLFAARVGAPGGHIIISFPSMHIAGGIALVWAVWPARARWPMVAVQALSFIGTPVWGFHFLADCIAGTALGLAAVALASTPWRHA